MRFWSLLIIGVFLWGCGGSLDVSSWLDSQSQISDLTLEMIGVYLLHTLPPGMEGQFRVSNGLTETARSFTIDYEEVPLAQGQQITRGFNPVDPEKVPLVNLPPAYTQTLDAQLIRALTAAGYEYRAIYEGQCYSPAFLPVYDIVILTLDQTDCISIFRSLGYYISIFDGDEDLHALNALIQDVTR